MNWVESLLKKRNQLRLADHALQVDKDGRRQTFVERLIKKTQDGTLGKETDDPTPEGEMSVNIGDTVNRNDGSTLMKVLTGVALLVGGLGGGVGINALLSASGDTPATAPQPDTDTDTSMEIELGEPLE